MNKSNQSLSNNPNFDASQNNSALEDSGNESEIEKLKEELNKAIQERDEYLDGWRRAKADFINYKKDEAKRFETLAKFANETLVKDLIAVLDSFDLALEALKENEKVEKGVYLIRSQLEDVLKKYGLERISVSVGQPFDPAVHDAIAVVESGHPSGVVVDEVERGYMLNGKLIRAARVKVSK